MGLITAGLALKPALSNAYANTSVNHAEDRLNQLVNAMTLDEKIGMLTGYNDFYIRGLKRLNIPELVMSDGPLGIASWGINGRATAFPATIAASASWNRGLLMELGKAYGQEWRSRGIHFLLAPGVNIYRSSKSGRNFEYFGEDPYLTSEMVVPYIKAVQNEGVIATVKHFAANNQEFDRYRISSEVDERTLMEIYLPAFKAAVQRAGVWACMAAYNPVNGIWSTQNKWLLNDMLIKEWGFKGLIMSDWGCTYSTAEALNAGLGLEMGSHRYFTKEKIEAALAAGQISQEIIDDKIKRIYRPCLALGFFDRPQLKREVPRYNTFANAMAKKAAREGCVLLKNEGSLLPLKRSELRSLAIIGPNAQPVLATDRFLKSGAFAYGGGGSSKVNPWMLTSILQGIADTAAADTKVYYDEGISNRYVSEVYSNSVFETPDGKKGLKGTYFNNLDLSGEPVLIRNDEHLNYYFGGADHKIAGLGAHNYSIVWGGYIVPAEDGEFHIFTNCQGAYKLFLNQQLVADRSGSQSFVKDVIPFQFIKNQKIEVRLEFVKKCDPAEMRFGYRKAPVWNETEAVHLAKMADSVVFCAGFDTDMEKEGSDRDFDLPYGQDQLISAIRKVNKNVIVVLLAGGGVDMSRWVDDVPVVLHSWYPGMEGGKVIAEILFGDTNPSGKLPISIERHWEDSSAYRNYDEDRASGKVHYREGILVGYRHFEKNKVKPLFPFGHGLSYTTFSYNNLKLSSKLFIKGKPLAVSFDITNTGQRAGFEVAQLYISDVKSSVLRPVKELKGFEKIWLNPGESKNVTLSVDDAALAFYDVKTKSWVIEPGLFEVLIGRSSVDIQLKEKFNFAG